MLPFPFPCPFHPECWWVSLKTRRKKEIKKRDQKKGSKKGEQRKEQTIIYPIFIKPKHHLKGVISRGHWELWQVASVEPNSQIWKFEERLGSSEVLSYTKDQAWRVLE